MNPPPLVPNCDHCGPLAKAKVSVLMRYGLLALCSHCMSLYGEDLAASEDFVACAWATTWRTIFNEHLRKAR